MKRGLEALVGNFFNLILQLLLLLFDVCLIFLGVLELSLKGGDLVIIKRDESSLSCVIN